MSFEYSITAALWVIASLWLISVICVVIGVLYVVKFLQDAMVLFRKIEHTIDDLRVRLGPVLEDSRKTLEDVRKTTLKVNEISTKVDGILNSISSAAAAARFVTGIIPVKGKSLLGGILNGIGLFKLFSNGGKNKNE
ncbi:MAG: hypothetical protein ILO36_01575 [Abditibacteriota bacterium]|nr:hypothetical protein [Abditibacteriota bacterium]